MSRRHEEEWYPFDSERQIPDLSLFKKREWCIHEIPGYTMEELNILAQNRAKENLPVPAGFTTMKEFLKYMICNLSDEAFEALSRPLDRLPFFINTKDKSPRVLAHWRLQVGR